MRRSLYPFGGGNKGMGGGGILRSAVRAGCVSGGSIQESFSCSTNSIKKRTNSCVDKNGGNNSVFSISSSSSKSSSGGFTSPPRCRSVVEESDWEYVNEMEAKRGGGKWNKYFHDFVFGTVPSVDEVNHALSAIQKVGVNPNEEEPICGFTDSDWIEPPCYSSMVALRPCGVDSVVDALDLLKDDPSIQKMVVSISSDEAIWNAVLNNEAVREFRDSMNEDAEKKLSSSNNSNGAIDIARWVINQIQSKVNQVVEKIMLVFHDVFQSPDEMNEGKVSPFEGKLRTSFFLSLVVMLMVAVTRSHAA